MAIIGLGMMWYIGGNREFGTKLPGDNEPEGERSWELLLH